MSPANDAAGERSKQPSQSRISPDDKAVYMLGVGAIGKLVAHSLRGIPDPPPVILLTHRRGQLRDWRIHEEKDLVIHRDGHSISERGFDMQLVVPPLRAFGIDVDDPEFVWNNPEGLKPHEAAMKLKERAQKSRSRSDALISVPFDSDTSIAEGEPAANAETSMETSEETRPHDKPEENKDIVDDHIDHLIITVKAHFTVSALLAVKHRLSAKSTICLLQNGMGVVDELNQHVFPDPEERPTYMLGIVSHGVNTPRGSDPFSAVHAGKGTIALSVLARRASDDGLKRNAEFDISTPAEFSPSSRHLMRTLQRTPVLGAIGVPPVDFLQQKLEKLAANAVINPLTSLLDGRNGTVINNYAVTRTMRLLLAEISLVLRSLPELRGLPNVPARFSAERLEAVVVSVARRTADNVSSMLGDIRAGKQTEIRYINGYIVRRGEELGIATVCNYMVLQMVLGKSKMVQDESRVTWAEGTPADTPERG